MAFISTQKGFNLIVLMTVLAIAAIVLSVGVPLLSATIERNNVSAEANRLMASINFARSQAVNKQQVVTLERKSGNANDWTEGWTVYSDGDSGGNEPMSTVANEDVLLKDFEPNTSGLSIMADSDGDHWISFLPSGRLDENAVVFIAVCNADLTDGITGSMIEVSLVGRVRRTTIEAADKTDNCSP